MKSFIVPSIKYAHWDSENFNVKVGFVQIPSSTFLSIEALTFLKEKAKEEDYKVIYIMLLDNGTIQVPSNLIDFTLLHVDRKVEYTKPVFCDRRVIISQIESYKDLYPSSELYSLAIESGKYSRFKLDLNFPPDVFETMYRIWIERSVRKEIADDVLIYKEKGNIMGMLTYKKNIYNATIGLIAVSPICQHAGVGSKLIHYLETCLLKDGIKTLNVATQGNNIQARQFYERNNFSVKEITNIYHLWI